MKKFKLLLLLMYLITFISNAQIDSVFVPEQNVKSIQKGKITLGVGAYLTHDLRQNEDDIFSYIITEKDNQLNIKISMGYFAKYGVLNGIGMRYERRNFETVYLDLFGDTIYYADKENIYSPIIFRKYYQPIFSSKRFFFITQPELAYARYTSIRNRTDYYTESKSTTKGNSVSLGFQIGILAFPLPNFSLEARVGPLGLGYTWEHFEEDGVRTSYNEYFFIHLTPRWYLINFVFTSYF